MQTHRQEETVLIAATTTTMPGLTLALPKLKRAS